MEGVKVSQYGLMFVWESFKRYLGQSWEIAALCLLGMIVSTFFLFRERAGRGKEAGQAVSENGVTMMNWAVLIMLGLTVYNPFLVRKFVPKLGMTSVYYRAFWAFPLLPAAAYCLTKPVFLWRKKAVRAGAIAAVAAAAIIVMPLNPGIRYHLQLPDNVYKVYGSIPVITDAIHEDFEKSELWQKRTEAAKDQDILTKKGARAFVKTLPRCVFPYELEFQVRQYDPSITLTCSRNQRLYYEGNRATGISYDESSKTYARRKTILDAMYLRDPGISIEGFRKAMKKTRTHYLVVEDTVDSGDFLTTAGCSLVENTAGYNIYSYGLE